MSISNLNEFSFSTNINTNNFPLLIVGFIKFLIVGLIKFLLVQILRHRKRISLFFAPPRSPAPEPDVPTTTENKGGEESGTFVRGDEAEVVLKGLGILGEGKLPSKTEVFDIFEEREPSLDEVREAFEVFDGNKDGFIDEEELQRVMGALGLKEGMEVKNCRRMIGAFDENGDGRIDFHEFVKFMEISFN